nr:PREDICTED: PR domain zinc finger protein 16-like isoform X2 [Bemisia tabaci]
MRSKSIARRLTPGSIDENGVDKSGGEEDDSMEEEAEVSSETSFKDKFNYFDSQIPAELELRNGGAGGIWTKERLHRGIRYGPYPGILRERPLEPKYAWEVRAAGRKGFLDATIGSLTWMKYVRSSDDEKEQNVRVHFFQGKIYFKIEQDLDRGHELVMGPRHPLHFDLCGNLTENRYDRESTSQLSSGTLDDSRDEQLDDEESNVCPRCETTFPSLEQLDDHLISEHSYPAEQYQCDLCPRSFCWRACLTRHQILLHGEQKKFNCENCNKDFSDPSNLQRHVRIHHAGARSFACQECGKTFTTSSGLKQHTHIHSSIKPFRCEAYTQFSNLCRHKRMHSNCRTQIKCTRCNQAFSTVNSLSKHKRACDNSPLEIPPASGMNPGHKPSAMTWMPLTAGQQTPSFFYPRPPTALPLSSLRQMDFPTTFLTPYEAFLQNYSRLGPPTFLPGSFLFDNTPSNQLNILDDSSDSLKPNGLALQNFANCRPKELNDMKNSNSDLKHHHSRESGFPFMLPSSKVSPSTGEEAGSSQRPSPARPLVSRCNSTSPREFQPKLGVKPPIFTKDDDETAEESELEGEKSRKPGTKRVHSLVESHHICDQPLDLSVKNSLDLSFKKTPRLEERLETKESELDNNKSADKIKSEEDPASPPERMDVSVCDEGLSRSDDEPSWESYSSKKLKADPEKTDVSDDLRSKSERLSASDERSPRKSPDKSGLLPPMACPKPKYPMSLEPFYRPPFSKSNFLHPRYDSLDSIINQERFLSHLPSPFGPGGLGPKPYLLGSYMNGHGQWPPPGNFGSSKPYQEILNQIPSNGPGTRSKDKYACKFCGKIFPRSANLTRHLRTHTGEQPYKCKYCERSFSISSNLQRHVRNIHNKEKPFKCHLCDRCFGQQTNLDRHLKKHEEDNESCVVAVADSPGSSNENEREDACFDEIRTFMGKVTDFRPNAYVNPIQTDPFSRVPVTTEEEEEEAEIDEDISDVGSPPNSTAQDSPISLIHPFKSESPPASLNLSLQTDYKKDGILNNNNTDAETIQIST